MTADEKSVRLSKRQLTYLKTNGILADTFPKTLESIAADSEQTRVFRIPRDKAEQIRSTLTDHLARVGFDAEYKTTSEGRILEELIDRFY